MAQLHKLVITCCLLFTSLGYPVVTTPTPVQSNIFEGDIYLDKSTKNILSQLMSPIASRDTIADPVRRWPNGRVPYEFGPVSEEVKRVFKESIAEYKKHTCIDIVPRTNERDYVYVVSERGCWSAIGRSKNRQKMSIGTYCESKGTIIHEIMHAIGFFHEQSRLDRDDYVTIHWENIEPGMKYNFQKYEHGKADSLGSPYDYDSIMHYPMYAFSSNRMATIVPKDPNAKIGQKNHFSAIDIEQINKLYRCDETKPITNRPDTLPPPITTKPTVCVDNNPSCYQWEQYCGIHQYVIQNCKRTCGCQVVTYPPIVYPPGVCVDNHPNCYQWKQHCQIKNPYVIQNCKKTCGCQVESYLQENTDLPTAKAFMNEKNIKRV